MATPIAAPTPPARAHKADVLAELPWRSPKAYPAKAPQMPATTIPANAKNRARFDGKASRRGGSSWLLLESVIVSNFQRKSGVPKRGGQRRIFFWLNLTPLLRRLLRSTRHAKKRHTVPRRAMAGEFTAKTFTATPSPVDAAGDRLALSTSSLPPTAQHGAPRMGRGGLWLPKSQPRLRGLRFAVLKQWWLWV